MQVLGGVALCRICARHTLLAILQPPCVCAWYNAVSLSPGVRGRRSESAAANQHDAIKAFVQGTVAEAAPVVPISAQLKYNIDAVCEYIIKKVAARAFACMFSCPQPASTPRKPLHACSVPSIALLPTACRCQAGVHECVGTNRGVHRRCRCRCATLYRRRR